MKHSNVPGLLKGNKEVFQDYSRGKKNKKGKESYGMSLLTLQKVREIDLIETYLNSQVRPLGKKLKLRKEKAEQT